MWCNWKYVARIWILRTTEWSGTLWRCAKGGDGVNAAQTYDFTYMVYTRLGLGGGGTTCLSAFMRFGQLTERVNTPRNMRTHILRKYMYSRRAYVMHTIIIVTIDIKSWWALPTKQPLPPPSPQHRHRRHQRRRLNRQPHTSVRCVSAYEFRLCYAYILTYYTYIYSWHGAHVWIQVIGLHFFLTLALLYFITQYACAASEPNDAEWVNTIEGVVEVGCRNLNNSPTHISV